MVFWLYLHFGFQKFHLTSPQVNQNSSMSAMCCQGAVPPIVSHFVTISPDEMLHSL